MGDVQEELTTKAQKAHEGEESKNQYLLLSIVRLCGKNFLLLRHPRFMLLRGKYHMLQNTALKPKNPVRISTPVRSRSIRVDACCGDFYPQVCVSVSKRVCVQCGRHCRKYPDARQSATAAERTIADACHVIGYYDARQAATVEKRIIADTRHVIGYRDARQTAAAAERGTADSSHAAGYRDTRQTGTVAERIIGYLGVAGYYYSF